MRIPSAREFWKFLISFCFFCCGRIMKKYMMAKIANIIIIME